MQIAVFLTTVITMTHLSLYRAINILVALLLLRCLYLWYFSFSSVLLSSMLCHWEWIVRINTIFTAQCLWYFYLFLSLFIIYSKIHYDCFYALRRVCTALLLLSSTEVSNNFRRSADANFTCLSKHNKSFKITYLLYYSFFNSDIIIFTEQEMWENLNWLSHLQQIII